MPEPDTEGGPPGGGSSGPPAAGGPPTAPVPTRPGGCLRACVVLLGLGFMGSVALCIVVILFQDQIVGLFVENQVKAFEQALDQTELSKEERDRGKDVAEQIGDAIKKGKIPRDQNLDDWKHIEKILGEFRAETDAGQKGLSPVQAREYIDKMQEVLDDLKEREKQTPPKPPR